jgi:hypothetical protein
LLERYFILYCTVVVVVADDATNCYISQMMELERTKDIQTEIMEKV